MIEIFAVVMALLHFVPWLYISFTDKKADFDLRLIFVLAAGLLGALVWKLTIEMPPLGFLFIFTAIYSWRTIFLHKSK